MQLEPTNLADTRGPAWPDRVGLAILLAAAALVFKEALRGYFVQDDYAWLVATRFGNIQEYLRSFLRFHPASVYRPLSQETVFWLGQKFFGLQPVAFHLLNIAFHLASVAMLYSFLRTFAPRVPSLLGSFFFAAHSAHVRSVYWIAAVSEPMAVTFFLASLYLFRRAVLEERPGFVWAALFAMCLGAASKESILTLPLVLAVYCLIFARRKFAWTAPFFLISALYLVAKLNSDLPAAPYPLEFNGNTLRNLQAYLTWCSGMSEGFIRVVLHAEPTRLYPWTALLVCVLGTVFFRAARDRKTAVFALIWFAVSMQPFLYFRQQSFGYYLAPALAAASLLLASAVPASRPRFAWGALPGTVAMLLIFAAVSYASIRSEGEWWNARTRVGKEILEQLATFDGVVPWNGRVFVCGLTSNELGTLHYEGALRAFGLRPERFVLVGVGNPLAGDLRRYAESEECRLSRCVVFRNGYFEDRTDQFRKNPLAFLAVVPEGYLDRPEVSIEAGPVELVRGRDELYFRVRNLHGNEIDLLYELDGVPMPPITHWRLSPDCSARVFVEPTTPPGHYRFVAVRESQIPNPRNWIRVDASFLIR